jgi:hypothetical protein
MQDGAKFCLLRSDGFDLNSSPVTALTVFPVKELQTVMEKVIFLLLEIISGSIPKHS